MRIVEQTPNMLVIEDRPWFMRAFVLGFIAISAASLWYNWAATPWFTRLAISGLLLLFAVALAKFTPTVTARFDRAGGAIDLTRRGLLGVQSARYALQHFRRARVEDSGGRPPTCRLVLVFSDSAAAQIAPELSARRERQKKWNPRGLAPNEVAFTAYLSSSGGPHEASPAINTWAGVAG